MEELETELLLVVRVSVEELPLGRSSSAVLVEMPSPRSWQEDALAENKKVSATVPAASPSPRPFSHKMDKNEIIKLYSNYSNLLRRSLGDWESFLGCKWLLFWRSS